MAAIKAVGVNACSGGARRMAFVLAVCTVGTTSVLRDTWPKAMHWPLIDLHAAFGVLLCLMVVAQFHAANLRAVPLSEVGLHTFCRRLTRLVFLMLYVLFGVNELVSVAVRLWNDGPHGSGQPALLPSPESLRVYLAYGVVALIIIRVLGAWMAQRSPTTSTTKESSISAGRGRGCSAVAAGAGPKSAVTR
jgi:cytochrome b561